MFYRQINYGDYNPTVHQPGFLKDKLNEVLPTHFITAKRRLELERRVLSEHAQTNQDEVEVYIYITFRDHFATSSLIKFDISFFLSIFVSAAAVVC